MNYSSLINEYLSTTFIKNAYESKDNERIQWIQKKIFKGLNKNNEELKEVIKGSNDNCFIF